MERLLEQHAPRSTQRWVSVGTSTEADSSRAGADAAAAALRGHDAKLLIVFCSDSHDLPAMLRAINDTSGGVPLIGCTTAGEIATDGPADSSVVVTALGGPGFSVATAVAANADGRQREAGAEVAGCVEAVEPREHRVLLLLTDGIVGGQEEIVRGAYGVLGAGVPLVGGSAGDYLKMKQSFQLHGDRVVTDAVVAAAISSDAPFGIGVRHGWSKVGDPMMVTRSADSRVYTLDDEPALDVYLRRLGAPPEVVADPSAFTSFAMTRPFGLRRRSGEEIRFIREANFADRSIGLAAAVPQGALTWLMRGDRTSVLDATDAACADAIAGLDGATPAGLLAFDCIARRGVLGEEGIRHEVRRVVELSAGVPVAGFYTYGEIARTRGINGFHNQTLVILAFGE
jgi:hypothetical protein